jgi:hypothetical protein
LLATEHRALSLLEEGMRLNSWTVALLLLVSIPAWADPLLVQKAGEWLITEAPGKDAKIIPPTKQCFRQKTIFAEVERMTNCSRKEISTVGNRSTADAICATGNTTVTFHGSVVADGENSFHSETIASYSPPIGNIAEIARITDGKWLGPCPEGEQPVN